HPRVYGTFPRVLGRYVREEKLLTLEEALEKMTSLPAKRLGLTDRGSIEEGKKADIVVFDPNTVIDKATFSQPHQYPDGIHYVLVNGIMTIADNKATEQFTGEVLRKNGE
ncbi:MAG TPA: amidohydrolase family protein, partial [Cyclobacteriaceae bacterium]|nr:amidohydrolase family protein [Cyclobacteriaceae bacterium]